MPFFFRSEPLTPIIRPDVDKAVLSLQKGGEVGLIAAEQIASFTGARFLLGMRPDSLKTHKKICRMGEKYRKRGEFTPLQLWQGAYFQKEIETAYIPPLQIKWIDDRIGWGVFAIRDLFPQEFIGEYSGVLRPWRRSDRKNGYCFEYVHLSGEPTPFLIDARDEGGITRYINHSGRPNLFPTLATIGNVTHLILLTKRKILAGEQLSYDYGPAYWKKRGAPLEI